MSLADLQRGFARALRDDEGGALSGLRLAAGGIPGSRSIDVYRNNSLGVLSGALADIFPACAALIGAETFERAALAFAREHEARGPDLNHYGADFPGFLASLPGLDGLVYLCDTARLEWLCHLAFYAAGDDDANDADPDPAGVFQALAEVADPTRAKLVARRPLYLLEAKFPVDRIRAVALSADDEVDLDAGGGRWIVFRREGDVGLQSISELHHAVLQAVQAGATLAELDAVLAGQAQDAIVALFQDLILSGWIMRVA